METLGNIWGRECCSWGGKFGSRGDRELSRTGAFSGLILMISCCRTLQKVGQWASRQGLGFTGLRERVRAKHSGLCDP